MKYPAPLEQELLADQMSLEAAYDLLLEKQAAAYLPQTGGKEPTERVVVYQKLDPLQIPGEGKKLPSQLPML